MIGYLLLIQSYFHMDRHNRHLLYRTKTLISYPQFLDFWWMWIETSTSSTTDGRNPANQLIAPRWLAGYLNHEH